MKILNAISVGYSAKLMETEPEHIFVQRDSNGQILGLRWKYPTHDNGVYNMTKKCGGTWNSADRIWTFQDPETAEAVLKKICQRNPDWPLFHNDQKHGSNIAFSSLSSLNFASDNAALILPFPLPYGTKVDALVAQEQLCVKVSTKKSEEAILVVGSIECINTIIHGLEQQGAKRDNNALARRFELTTGSKIQVKVSGWAVAIICDLSNPFHYIIKPQQEFKWVGVYPNGIKHAIPWDGVIHITRKRWKAWAERINAVGLEWEGDNPENDLVTPSTFNHAIIPGWHTPAANGYVLHDYQKKGAEFCAARGMRALVGDEMGVGKTAQAIAAAEGISASRVLVICPANARYVWDSEITGWSSGGSIQHVLNQLDTLDHAARWHIVTYEQLSVRTETWTIVDKIDENAIRSARPDLVEQISSQQSYPKKIKLEQWSSATPEFTNAGQIGKWGEKMRRLNGELIAQILAAGPILMIVDEAHRVKNHNAKRTKAVQRIARGNEGEVLLLTGTPVRNNEHEAAVLLSILDANAASALSKSKGYTIEDVKSYLDYFMIRRTKTEVLPELPEKTRQRIDIDQLDKNSLRDYTDALAYARQLHSDAIIRGESESGGVRQAIQGAIEKARSYLGLAKILGGEVADLVTGVVESKGCCVVFCAHHQVSDELDAQLKKAKLRSAVIDGRTQQIDRARFVKDFQEGNIDVFIGGINAAGEAITLTRSDTVVFVELDWVPAALLQAEDRIHRVGQRANCQVIQLIARLPGDNLDAAMIAAIGSKLERIGTLLDESTENIINGQGSLKNEIIDRLLGKSAAPEVIEGKKMKSGPGRPRSNSPLPTATERVKKSIDDLVAAGGKRVMLRLTPDGYEALRTIMIIEGIGNETGAINSALIERKRQLLSMPTE